MSLEIRPHGTECNLNCKYCYQQHYKEQRNFNFEDFKPKLNSNFTLFGGDPLVQSLQELDEMFKYGYEKFGKNSIQTNGLQITDKHIELFKKYNVNIGISIDGEGELNDLRWQNTLKQTRVQTKKTNENIKKVVDAGLNIGLIITLHKQNIGTEEKLNKMIKWFEKLDSIGITSQRLHLLEQEHGEGDDYQLSNEEYQKQFIEIHKKTYKLKNIKFDVFQDVKKLLLGQDNMTTCLFNGCDPLNTQSVSTIDYNGTKGCGREYKDGKEWNKQNDSFDNRSLQLYFIPQEDGGCMGCKYFIICKGSCPGTQVDGDWRNRTEYCDFWKSIFQYMNDLLTKSGFQTVIERPDLKFIEKTYIENGIKGNKIYTNTIISTINERRNNQC